jgi:type IV pilus assembly protein PilB
MSDELQKQINDLISTPFGGVTSSPVNEPDDSGEFLDTAEAKEIEVDKDDEILDEKKVVEKSSDQVEEFAEKPLYEREEEKKEDAVKSEEDRFGERKNRIEDLYGGKVQQNEVEKSVLKVASEDREDELGSKMKEIELNRKEDEIKSKAITAGMGYINLKGLPIVPEALRLISEEESKENGIIAFMYKKDIEIRVAVLEFNSKVDEIGKRISDEHDKVAVKFYLTSRVSMDDGLKMYAGLPKIIIKVDDIEILQTDLEKTAEDLKDIKELEEKIHKISVTQVVSLILAAALKVESSDIHIEAEESGISLRFRIDGVLHDIARLEREVWDKLVSRIKLSSKLKLNIKDKPQDGSFSVHIKGKPIDFRVSTLPTAFGESIVMRVLYHEKVKEMKLDNLGIAKYNRSVLDKELKRPNGMIVITGPTGSGKTTTLYAILNKLNSADNKVITIEDPIEYKIEGISQSQVNKDKGYTFAKALKSVVRQDPDIILVGEIRDKETAEISLNAALTGHLLFATLHTNDVAGTIPRFLALGAKGYLLAPALNVSLAQRLVRKICDSCRVEDPLDETKKERVRAELEKMPETHRSLVPDLASSKFYKGGGCDKCAGLGYKGQIGIFEIFQVTDEIRDMVLSNEVSEHKMMEIGVKNGMITMVQDGLLKAIKGVTSIDEVFRVS